jgi:hypothetical protein
VLAIDTLYTAFLFLGNAVMYTEIVAEELELDAALDCCLVKSRLVMGLEDIFESLPTDCDMGKTVLAVAATNTGNTPTYSAEGISDFLAQLWEGIKNVMSKIWENIKKFGAWLRAGVLRLFGMSKSIKEEADGKLDLVGQIKAEQLQFLKGMAAYDDGIRNAMNLSEGRVGAIIDAVDEFSKKEIPTTEETMANARAFLDAKRAAKDAKAITDKLAMGEIEVTSTKDPESGEETLVGFNYVPNKPAKDSDKVTKITGKDISKMAGEISKTESKVLDMTKRLTDTKWAEDAIKKMDSMIRRLGSAPEGKVKRYVARKSRELSRAIQTEIKLNKIIADDLKKTLDASISGLDGALKSLSNK